jgi:hypothetical protein
MFQVTNDEWARTAVGRRTYCIFELGAHIHETPPACLRDLFEALNPISGDEIQMTLTVTHWKIKYRMEPAPNVYMMISRVCNPERAEDDGGCFGSSSNREYCARRGVDSDKFRYDGKKTPYLEGKWDSVLFPKWSSRGPEVGRHLNGPVARNARQARMVNIRISSIRLSGR